MTALHHIHEPGILYNLGERAKLDFQRPYTFMVRQTGEGGSKRPEKTRGRGGAVKWGGSIDLMSAGLWALLFRRTQTV